jgi:hypothetical protein
MLRYNNLFFPIAFSHSDDVQIVPIAVDFFGRMAKEGLDFIQKTTRHIVQAPELAEARITAMPSIADLVRLVPYELILQSGFLYLVATYKL